MASISIPTASPSTPTTAAPAAGGGNAPVTNNSVIQTTGAQRTQTAQNVSQFSNLQAKIDNINSSNALSEKEKGMAVADLKNAASKSGQPASGTMNGTQSGTMTTGNTNTPVAPANPGGGAKLPDGTTAVNTQDVDDPITGKPAGAAGFKTDENGDKVWVDVNGNSLADSTDPMTSMKGKIADMTSRAKAQIEGIKSTLTQATAFADQGTSALIQQIQSMYATRIQGVHEAYQAFAGKQQESSIRNGLERYAPVQAQGLLTDTEVQEQTKITDFITKMASAITRAQSAQQSGDTKLFNSAYNEINKIQKDLGTSVNNLFKEANKAVADKAKADHQAQKDSMAEIKNNIGNAKTLAPSIAAELTGVKDPKKRKEIIDRVAKDYNLDPGVLSGYVDEASTKNSQAAGRASRAAANAGPKPPKAPKGGKDGAYSYSADDISTYSNLMNKGGKSPNGTVFNGRGEDGYVDPGTYISSFTDWTKNGGTPQGFVKQFPVTNVNPEDYSKLPKALQPKAKAGSAKDTNLDNLAN